MAKRKKKSVAPMKRKIETMEKRNVERVAVSLGVLLGVLYILYILAFSLAPEATTYFFVALFQGTLDISMPSITFDSFFIGLVAAVAAGALTGVLYGKINNMLKTA